MLVTTPVAPLCSQVLQDASTVQPMIERTVRVEGLRTYLFQYSGFMVP